jgi:TRAP-type transport system periplasmic protein
MSFATRAYACEPPSLADDQCPAGVRNGYADRCAGTVKGLRNRTQSLRPKSSSLCRALTCRRLSPVLRTDLPPKSFERLPLMVVEMAMLPCDEKLRSRRGIADCPGRQTHFQRMMAAVLYQGRLRRPSTVNRFSLSTPSADGTHRSRRPWRFVSLVLLIASFASWPNSTPLAQERVLRFHHILPEQSPQQRLIFLPWSKKIAEASNGRLRLNVAAGMRLGGKPNELLSQVESKYVDIAWILAAYTPGKFPRLEVFELPFIASSRASVTSQALFEYYETYARAELSNVHVLNVWCHPSGVILNQEEPILRPSDAAGRVMRVPSDVIGGLFRDIGATPKIATVTQVLTLLKQRQIAGTVLPYEVIPTLKLTSEIRHITEFAGHRGLYTAVFLLVMNKDVYASLDADLRRVLDAHSGVVIAAEWGRFFDEFEEIGRDNFTAAGGVVTFVKNENYEEWVQASQPAIDSWVAKVGRVGIDGVKLISSARQLVAKYAMMARPY